MQNDIEAYLEELNALREDLRSFGERYPHLATMLGASSNGDMSPDVQYLAESIAFVATKIRAEIQNAPKDLAFLIVKNIAPALVRKQVCAGIVKVRLGGVTERKIKKLLHLKSRLKYSGKNGKAFFSYTGDIGLVPYEVDRNIKFINEKISINVGNARKVHIGLRYYDFEDFNNVNLINIRFYLPGSRIRTWNILEKLFRGFVSCKVYLSSGKLLQELGPESLRMAIDEKFKQVNEGAWDDCCDQLREMLVNPDCFNFFLLKDIKHIISAGNLEAVFYVDGLSVEDAEYLESSVMTNAVSIENKYSIKNAVVQLKKDEAELMIPRQSDEVELWDVVKVNSVSLLVGSEERVLTEADEIMQSGGDLNKTLTWQQFVRDKPLTKYSYATTGIRLINLEKSNYDDIKKYVKLNYDLCNCNTPEKIEIGEILVDDYSGNCVELISRFSSFAKGLSPSSITSEKIEMIAKASRGITEKNLLNGLSDILTLYGSSDLEIMGLFKNCLSGIKKEYTAKHETGMPYGTYRLMENINIMMKGGEEWRGVSFIYSKIISIALRVAHRGEIPYSISILNDREVLN